MTMTQQKTSQIKHPPQLTIGGWVGMVTQTLLLVVTALVPFMFAAVSRGTTTVYATIYTVPKFYWLEAVVVLAWICWNATRRPGRATLAVYWPLLILCGLAFLSAAWALLPTLAVVTAAHLTVMAMFAVMIGSELKDSQFRATLVIVLLGSATVQSIWGIAQFVLQRDLGLQRLGESLLTPGGFQIASLAGNPPLLRAYGVFPHPNVLAGFLGLGLVIGIAVLFSERLRRWYAQLGIGVVLGVIAAGLLLTYSRAGVVFGGLAGLAVTGAGLWIFRRFPWGLLLIIPCLLITFLPNRTLTVERAGGGDVANQAIPDRLVQFQIAEQMITARPYGVGAGNYAPTADVFRPDLGGYEKQPVHNVVLLLATELSILAVAMLGIFVGRGGWNVIKRRLSPAGDPLAGIVALSATGFVLLTGLTDHYWLTLPQGLLLAGLVLGMVGAFCYPSTTRN